MKNRMVKGIKKTLIAVAGLTTFGLADNPISSYHYLADPSAAADSNYFYILTDSDDPATSDPAKKDPTNGQWPYTIKALYAFRSSDMKNWTDYGIVYEAGREDEHVGDIWASGIAVDKNGKFHIVFPDGGGGGIGLIESEEIGGPYRNPVAGGKKLIGWGDAAITNCDGIGWCFDPAIFIDDDGKAYFTVGGGSSDSHPHNNNFILYQFNGSINNFDLSSKTNLSFSPNDGTNSMEASYIHKNGNTYYLSYSTTNLKIAYATSTNVKGPYTYKGIFMENPNINGQNINANNNNHHGIAKFKDRWYVAYHDRRLVQASEHPSSLGYVNPEPANHRSVSIDEMFYNADGSLQKLTYTNEGPEQIENFNPYKKYPALTSSKQRNVRSYTDWNKNDWNNGIAAKHVLTPLASKESWIRVSGVDFGTEGAKSFSVVAASIENGNKIEIHKGSVSGTLAGTCNLQKTSGWNDYAENSCDMTGLTGLVDQLFIVFKGSRDSTMGILEWSFTCSGSNCKASEPQKQTPFGGVAANIPGIIEAENFDIPGSGYANKSYNEGDSEDQGAQSNGGTSYREGTGVDIYKKATGYIVGYNQENDWLEYTVNVAEAGNYTVFATVATDNETSGFTLSLDGEPLASFEPLSSFDIKGTSFDAFDTVQANVNIPSAGTHILRMTVTGAWFDVDFFAFAKGNDAKIEDVPAALPQMARFNASSTITYNVFDLRGGKVASFTVKNSDNVDIKTTVTNLVKRSGFYLLKPSHGGSVKRIAITK